MRVQKYFWQYKIQMNKPNLMQFFETRKSQMQNIMILSRFFIFLKIENLLSNFERKK
ncbi:hypothetical protein TTHERM_000817301 (macronuclear) [Tetrahymena thermophila SB210]|uniref:Uncharacterized protein n=1 Tax=Tetrahymena thermophila (strain SB210) TaxID=312017 RepID=W7XI66_TETTS|nr:hypothetical protein TTHERM_000817301 [Tetrahymena thermophila SB210]EWS74351.1 hypothetical protein TTHERM_000817301 [Tetrahymena thermophila SB210]|eukprot:XP_012653111.1 hypothetical protein TTHERM_000817301 [Tetrahymena thermophila SB210]